MCLFCPLHEFTTVEEFSIRFRTASNGRGELAFISNDCRCERASKVVAKLGYRVVKQVAVIPHCQNQADATKTTVV